MKNCKQCGHNDFSFKSRNEFTVVTCRHCNNEFEFVRKQKPASQDKHCNVCKAKVEREKIILTPQILLEQSYYTYQYKCTKCGNTFPDPTTKRFNLLYNKSR